MATFDDVILLSMEGCPYCEEARADLRERGLEFQEIELEPRSELLAHLAAVMGDVKVPMVVYVGHNGTCSFGPAAYCTLPERTDQQ